MIRAIYSHSFPRPSQGLLSWIAALDPLSSLELIEGFAPLCAPVSERCLRLRWFRTGMRQTQGTQDLPYSHQVTARTDDPRPSTR